MMRCEKGSDEIPLALSYPLCLEGPKGANRRSPLAATREAHSLREGIDPELSKPYQFQGRDPNPLKESSDHKFAQALV